MLRNPDKTLTTGRHRMDLNNEDIRQGLITYLLIVISIALHESAHAFVADRLGDDTPRSQGRVTLNPLAHLDPIGTGLLPLLNIFVLKGVSLLGWGRPVQINLSNFRHRVRDELLVTAAGPLCNVLLALAGVVAAALCHRTGSGLALLFDRFMVINVGLAVFNMLPIPPLDGSHFLRHLVGMSEETYIGLSTWGGVALLVLINVPAFRALMTVVLDFSFIPFHWLYVRLC